MKLVLYDPDAPEAAAIWRTLGDRAESYFVSPGWVENWLACLPAADRPAFAVIWRTGPLDDPAAHAAIPPTKSVTLLKERVGALGHVGTEPVR